MSYAFRKERERERNVRMELIFTNISSSNPWIENQLEEAWLLVQGGGVIKPEW